MLHTCRFGLTCVMLIVVLLWHREGWFSLITLEQGVPKIFFVVLGTILLFCQVRGSSAY
jgi:hypothetical protein